MIIDPVVNATPPGAKVTAGYLTLMNESDKAITITGAYSPTISKVEIHLSSVKDDVASMEKQDTVSIDAGGKLVLEHGSYHLMLMDLVEPLKDGDMVDIVLMTSIGDMLIEMPVRKQGMHMDKDKKTDMKPDDHTDMKMDEDKTSDVKKDGAAHTQETKIVR